MVALVKEEEREEEEETLATGQSWRTAPLRSSSSRRGVRRRCGVVYESIEEGAWDAVRGGGGTPIPALACVRPLPSPLLCETDDHDDEGGGK